MARTLPNSRTRSVWMVALFAAVQIADATMTLVGVQRFGLAAEGNPLLFMALSTCGVGVTLFGAKSVAIALAVVLHRRSHPLALSLLIVVYVYGAICPWAFALS